jgi:UPF0755 protein
MKKNILLIIILSFVYSYGAIISIPKGASIGHIATLLKQQNLIKNELTFKLQVKLKKKEQSFFYGNFKVMPGNINSLITQLLDKNNLVYNRVTIPEGYTLFKIDALLAKKGYINPGAFYDFTTDPKQFKHLLKSIPELYNDPKVTRLEGFLFPETYYFEEDTPLIIIVKKMISTFEEKVMPLYKKREKEHNLPSRYGNPLSLHNIISLSSIVEQEAQVAKERPLIAAVFLNRLNRRMILGSCSTIHYARSLAGLPFKSELRYKDTQINSPYNTYDKLGLPPSPIGNPGLASIHATLYPSKTNYLYFVSKTNGEHHFSTSITEHEKMRLLYLGN